MFDLKAIKYTQYGGQEVLQYVELDRPVPGRNDLLVKVHFGTVNRTDCATVRAKPWFMRLVTGLFKPKKEIPGTEFAGEVIEAGKEVTKFKVGDRVFGFNDTGLESWAEYLVISEEDHLGVIPEKIKIEEVANTLEGTHYGYNFINKVTMREGDRILVNGASGAIGSATLQILANMGAHVTAVCSTNNIELMKSLGAGQVIDYTLQDFTALDEEYNHIFDTVGKSSFSKCRKLIKEGGVYISSEMGKNSENVFYSLFTPLLSRLPGRFYRKKVVFPVPRNVTDTIQLVTKLVSEGKFKAVVDRTYNLQTVPDAFGYVERGEKTGSVLIGIVRVT